MDIYCIGGSPCSGKSTVAQVLAEQYGLAYFKADDYLTDFTAQGAAAGLPHLLTDGSIPPALAQVAALFQLDSLLCQTHARPLLTGGNA